MVEDCSLAPGSGAVRGVDKRARESESEVDSDESGDEEPTLRERADSDYEDDNCENNIVLKGKRLLEEQEPLHFDEAKMSELQGPLSRALMLAAHCVQTQHLVCDLKGVLGGKWIQGDQTCDAGAADQRVTHVLSRSACMHQYEPQLPGVLRSP